MTTDDERLARILADIRAMRTWTTADVLAVVSALLARQPSHIDIGAPMLLLDCALGLEDTISDEKRADEQYAKPERIPEPQTISRLDQLIPSFQFQP